MTKQSKKKSKKNSEKYLNEVMANWSVKIKAAPEKDQPNCKLLLLKNLICGYVIIE